MTGVFYGRAFFGGLFFEFRGPLAARLFGAIGGTPGGGGSPLLTSLMALGLAVALVVLIGLVSCLVPTRRIFRVQASEALRAEG